MHACKSKKKHSITAMVDFYGISFYHIMHENNLRIKNSFWSYFSKVLGLRTILNCILLFIYLYV